MNTNKMFLLEEYGTFFKYLVDDRINIPNIGTKYIPQGVCIVDDNILITAYDEEKKSNSLIYIIDKNKGYEGKVELDGKYHTGGISYDKKNRKIYITGYGSNEGVSYVNVYSVDKVLSNKGSILKPEKKIKVDNNFELLSMATRKKRSSPAYLNIANNYLYVGNYHNTKSIIKKYNITDNIDEETYQIINNPFYYTQGMCIYNYDNKDYYIFSCSKGRKNSSVLYISTLEDNKLIKLKEIVMPCLSEQVSTSNDEIVIIFESGARKYYQNAKEVISSICFLDIKKIVEDLNR